MSQEVSDEADGAAKVSVWDVLHSWLYTFRGWSFLAHCVCRQVSNVTLAACGVALCREHTVTFFSLLAVAVAADWAADKWLLHYHKKVWLFFDKEH